MKYLAAIGAPTFVTFITGLDKVPLSMCVCVSLIVAIACGSAIFIHNWWEYNH